MIRNLKITIVALKSTPLNRRVYKPWVIDPGREREKERKREQERGR